MQLFKNIWQALLSCLKVDIIDTLRANFLFFPLNIAIKLPIIVFKGTALHIGKNAKIKLLCAPAKGILWIGALDRKCIPKGVRNYISIDGTLNIGGNVKFSYNSHIVIGKNAILTLGGENYINHDTRFLVHECVTLEYCARIGWNTQICDTAFHYVDVGGIVARKTKPITIGREAWVSSFCNVGRGAYLPDYSILSNCSLLNKDYSSFGAKLLIAGIPAKILKTDVKRIMETVEPELCIKIDQYFEHNPAENILKLSELKDENR